MVGDGGDAEIPGGVTPPVDQAYHGDDGNTWVSRRLLISPGVGGTGSRGTKPHNIVHKEVTGGHNRKVGVPPKL